MIYSWPNRVAYRTYQGWSDRAPTKADVARRKAVDAYVDEHDKWPTPTGMELVEIQERNL